MRQRQIREHALQPSILSLEFLQSPKLRDIQAAVLRLPVVERRFADTVLANQFCDFHAGFRLLQDRDDLLFTEPGLLHKSFPVGKLYSPLVLFVRGLQHTSIRASVARQFYFLAIRTTFLGDSLNDCGRLTICNRH